MVAQPVLVNVCLEVLVALDFFTHIPTNILRKCKEKTAPSTASSTTYMYRHIVSMLVIETH